MVVQICSVVVRNCCYHTYSAGQVMRVHRPAGSSCAAAHGSTARFCACQATSSAAGMAAPTIWQQPRAAASTHPAVQGDKAGVAAAHAALARLPLWRHHRHLHLGNVERKDGKSTGSSRRAAGHENGRLSGCQGSGSRTVCRQQPGSCDYPNTHLVEHRGLAIRQLRLAPAGDAEGVAPAAAGWRAAAAGGR